MKFESEYKTVQKNRKRTRDKEWKKNRRVENNKNFKLNYKTVQLKITRVEPSHNKNTD